MEEGCDKFGLVLLIHVADIVTGHWTLETDGSLMPSETVYTGN